MDTSLLGNSVSALPQSSDSLELSVKVDARLAVESASTATSNTLLVTSEGEHGQRYGDGHIDANLAGLDVAAERLGCRARLGEDGNTVTVFVLVDQIDGVVNGLDVKADKDRAENLLLVAGHVSGDVGDDGRTHKVAIGVLLVLVVAAVEENRGALLLGAVNEAQDTLLAVGRDDRAEVGALFETTANLELLGTLSDLTEPLLGLANHDEGAEGHASLTSGTEGSANDAVNEVVLVAVGKDCSVVLGTKVGLDTLTIGGTAGEDVLAGLVATDEADGLDGGLVEDEVDGFMSTMDDVDDTSGETGLLAEFSKDHGSARVTFRGLQNKGIARDGSHGDTPERNHGREV